MPRKTRSQDKDTERDDNDENTNEDTVDNENEELKEKEKTIKNNNENEKHKENVESGNSDDEKQDEDSSSEVGEQQPPQTTPPAQSSTIEKPPSATANNYPNTLIDSTLKFFVGGLHPNTDEAELSAYFSKYGQILATQVMRDLTTGRHRGFGFVTIKVQPNSMSVFKDNHTVTGKRIDVRAMQTDVAAGLRKKIFVGGLSKALNEEMLEEYFSKFGEVEKVTIMRQLDGTSRGFGFIVFATDEAAGGALKNPTHFVYGNKVDVRAAETRTKNPPPAPMNVVYPYGVMHTTPTTDVYSHSTPVYRPQTTYDPNQYANMSQQQMLQQYPQYQLLQQQMVQQQMAMAGSYGSYYGATAQQTPGAATAAPAGTPPTANPYTAASVSYGPYRGKTDPVYQSGPNDPTSSRGSYRQQPY